MLFLIPKRKISLFDYEGRSARRISSYRRFEHRSTNYLVMFLLSICLLAFSVRIGSLLWMMLTNMGQTDLIFALQGVNLPYSRSEETIQNKRLIQYISINKYGNYKVEGYYIDLENLELYLQNKRYSLPNLIIGIVADKDCKMDDVYKLIRVMRKSGCLRTFFYVNKHINNHITS